MKDIKRALLAISEMWHRTLTLNEKALSDGVIGAEKREFRHLPRAHPFRGSREWRRFARKLAKKYNRRFHEVAERGRY